MLWLRWLGHAGSVVSVHRLSCPNSMWDPPRPGIVPYTGRQIFNHCTTREVLCMVFSAKARKPGEGTKRARGLIER